MRFGVLGYGSIGRRHALNVRASGHDVVLIRRQAASKNEDGFPEVESLDRAVQEFSLDAAIISSPTSHHLADAKDCLRHRLPFLMEKPPALTLGEALNLQRLIDEGAVYELGFNLRYFPMFKFVREFIPELGRIYSVRAAVGQHLSLWRPGRDYRQTTSAKTELGGGVHIELVHEIDYLNWIFGRPNRVTGRLRKISDLEINSVDLCVGIFDYIDGPVVELHLDYLAHQPFRTCEVIAEKGTLSIDIRAGTVDVSDGDTSRRVFETDPQQQLDGSYVAELTQFIDVIEGRASTRVTMAEAVDAMTVLEAITLSNKSEKAVYLAELGGEL